MQRRAVFPRGDLHALPRPLALARTAKALQSGKLKKHEKGATRIFRVRPLRALQPLDRLQSALGQNGLHRCALQRERHGLAVDVADLDHDVLLAHVGDASGMPPTVTISSPLVSASHIFWCSLLALLLRTNQEEPENNEDEDDRNDLHEKTFKPPAASAPGPTRQK